MPETDFAANIIMPNLGVGEFGGVTLEADLGELPGTFTVGYSSIGFQLDDAMVTADVEVLDVEGKAALASVGAEWTCVFGGYFARISRRLSAASLSCISKVNKRKD